VRFIYISVAIEVSTFSEKSYNAWIFSKFMTTKCPPTDRSVLVNSDSLDESSLNVVRRDGNCQNLNFQLSETVAQQFSRHILCAFKNTYFIMSTKFSLLGHVLPQNVFIFTFVYKKAFLYL
jgi:hypothetical protein